MKSPMRRFVSNHYYRELYQRMQSLNRSTKSVDEKFKKIEHAMIRANIQDIEAIVTRFINDLNRDITHCGVASLYEVGDDAYDHEGRETT